MSTNLSLKSERSFPSSQRPKTEQESSLVLRILAFCFWGSTALASTGSIRVDVSNAPGEITLDGMPTDQIAPAVIESVAPGEHVVELHYGCMSGSARVTVYEERTTTARMRMRNIGGEGTVRLRGLPPMARVFVDDAPVRQAGEGVELPCGGHRIRAEAEGFADWEETVAVTTGKWSTVTIRMVEIDIEDGPRAQAFTPVELEDDLDAFDDINWEEEDRLLAAEESAAAEQRAAERAGESRRERFGDVDGLDESEDEPPALGPEPLGDYDEDLGPSEASLEPEIDRLEERDETPQREPREAKNVLLYSGLGTAAAGLGGIIYGAVLHARYLEAKSEWNAIAAATGSPTSPEAQAFGAEFMNPAKARRNRVLGLSTSLLVAGGGVTAYGFFQLSAPDGTGLELPPQDNYDEDWMLTPTHFGVRYSALW